MVEGGLNLFQRLRFRAIAVDTRSSETHSHCTRTAKLQISDKVLTRSGSSCPTLIIARDQAEFDTTESGAGIGIHVDLLIPKKSSTRTQEEGLCAGPRNSSHAASSLSPI